MTFRRLLINGLILSALAIATLAATGCTTVQPWERGRLAQPGMALESDPLLAAMDEHIYVSKEAAAGTTGPAGGGCGCN